MSVFRIRYEQAGGHIHCSLFAAKSPNYTYAKCGDFCVTAGEEFEALQRALSGVAFLPKAEMQQVTAPAVRGVSAEPLPSPPPQVEGGER